MTAASITGGGTGASRTIAADIPVAGIDKTTAATAVRSLRCGAERVTSSAWTVGVRAL
jgi:hypothetical protein